MHSSQELDPPRDPVRLLALVAAVLMIALPPLYPNHMWPIPSFYEEWLAAVIAMLLVTAFALRSGKSELSVPWSSAPLLGLALVLGTQYALGLYGYPQQIQWGVLFLMLALLVMWAGVQARESLGLPFVTRCIALGLIVSAELNAFCIFAQAYGIPSWLDGSVMLYQPGTRFHANIGQSNLYVHYTALALASIAYLVADGRLRPMIGVAVAWPMLYGISLAGSRGAIIYLAAIVAVAIYFGRAGRTPVLTRGIRFGSQILVLLLLTDLLLTFSGLNPGEGLLGRMGSIATEGHLASDGLSLRLQTWRIAFDTFLSNPLIGAGFGSFGAEYMARSLGLPDSGIHAYASYAHNLPLQMLAETGLLGAICALFVLGGWLLQNAIAPPTLERWWMVSIISIITIHSMIEFPIWYANFLVIAAFVFGMGEQRTWRLQRPALGVTVIIAIVASGSLFLVNLQRDFADLRLWLLSRDVERLERLGGQEKMNEVVARLRARILRPQAERELALRFPVSEADLAEKIEISGRLLRFSPIDPILERQILLLWLAARTDEARVLIEQKLAVYPRSTLQFRQTVLALAEQRPDVFAPLVTELDRKGGVASLRTH